MTAETDLAKLARQIARMAMDKDVGLSDKLDAFKALSTFHVAMAKVRKDMPADDEEASTLDNIRRRIEATEPDGETVQ